MFETSLIFKTFLILSSQFGLIFLGCFALIDQAKKSYMTGNKLFGIEFIARKNAKNELDLIPIYLDKNRVEDPKVKSEKVTPLFLLWVISLLAMVVLAHKSLFAGLLLMTLASIAFVPLLALVMLEMDENDGVRATQITFTITLLAAAVGMYSGIDFGFLRGFLFCGLLAVILFNTARIFIGLSNSILRIKTFFGAGLFTLFLVYDFNQLVKLDDKGLNDWNTALHLSINIYLDVINLLLEILAAMGE